MASRDFELICGVESSTRADLLHVRHQVAARPEAEIA
jgi:hypothetical protein